jgi:hypothetical protein
MDKWRPKKFFSHFFSNKRRSIPTLSPDALVANEGSNGRGPRVAQLNEHFDPAGVRVLFFSRGRGRGHAIPDIAIAEEFPQLGGKISIQFVSYATGADTFRNSGWSVIDMGLPEANPFMATLLNAHALIRDLKPDVVIAHEEYAVLPAARMAGVPCILLTDWFPPAGQVAGESVTLADSIVFMGESGVFPLPGPVQRAPLFVGPVVRKMKYDLGDRPKARAELEISDSALVASVIPGAWATEGRSPIAQTILTAFRQLPSSDKVLFWLTKIDHEAISQLSAGLPNVRVVKECNAVEQIMVASDVVITKGNRGTIMDAASLGVPSISLSYGTNPIDEALVARIRSNKAFNANATDATMLCAYIERLASIPISRRAEPLGLHRHGGAAVANALLDEINRLVRASGAEAAQLRLPVKQTKKN